MKKLLKKNACVVSLIVFFCSVSFAQNTMQIQSSSCVSSYMLPLTARVSTSGTEVISGQFENDSTEFIKFDQTLVGRRFTIDGISLEDFVVFEGSVYFCGSTGDDGVLGYFKESEFGTSQVNINYVIIPKQYNRNIAKKIRVYKDDETSQVKIVVAVKEFKIDISIPLIHYNYLYVGVISGGNFIGDRFQISTGNSGGNNDVDRIQDVVLTDDYIVTIGVDSLSNLSIFLSKIPKSNTSSIDCRIITDPTPLSVNGPLVIEHLEGNDVAFSTLFTDVANNKNYARVFTYDMNSFTNTNLQDVELRQKSDPVDLQYLPDDNSLLLTLTEYECPSPGDVSGAIFYLDPYATATYTADYLYDKDQRFYSFDRITGSLFLVGGKKVSSERLYLVRDKQAGAFSDCYHYSGTQVTIRRPLMNTYANIPHFTFTFPVNILKSYPYDFILYPKCNE